MKLTKQNGRLQSELTTAQELVASLQSQLAQLQQSQIGLEGREGRAARPKSQTLTAQVSEMEEATRTTIEAHEADSYPPNQPPQSRGLRSSSLTSSLDAANLDLAQQRLNSYSFRRCHRCTRISTQRASNPIRCELVAASSADAANLADAGAKITDLTAQMAVLEEESKASATQLFESQTSKTTFEARSTLFKQSTQNSNASSLNETPPSTPATHRILDAQRRAR